MRIEVRRQCREATVEAREAALGRNFRAPHHTVSQAGLVSELAIAACGVLLLDEVESFSAQALRSLRNTLEFMHEDARPALFLTHACEEMPGRIQELFGPELWRRPGVK